MTLFSNICAAIVVLAIAWWVVGVMMMSGDRTYISNEAPWSVRLSTAWHSGFALPYIFLMHGVVAGVIVREEVPTTEDEARFQKWIANKRASCPCPTCRQRRGEDA